MLVISRKIGESIILSDNIKITVVSAGNDKVTIGIEAPRDINIAREELVETIEANKASAEKLDSRNYTYLAELIKTTKNG